MIRLPYTHHFSFFYFEIVYSLLKAVRGETSLLDLLLLRAFHQITGHLSELFSGQAVGGLQSSCCIFVFHLIWRLNWSYHFVISFTRFFMDCFLDFQLCIFVGFGPKSKAGEDKSWNSMGEDAPDGRRTNSELVANSERHLRYYRGGTHFLYICASFLRQSEIMFLGPV